MYRLMREQMFTVANGDRAAAPDIAIVVTDGESNIDRQYTIPYAQQAHREGIHMFAIGIGDEVDRTVGLNTTSINRLCRIISQTVWKCFSGIVWHSKQRRPCLPCRQL